VVQYEFQLSGLRTHDQPDRYAKKLLIRPPREKGEPTVKNHRILLITGLLILALGSVASQFAQDISSGPRKADPGRRSLLFGLVRTINTAEAQERIEYGSYGLWRTLLEHHQEYLNSWLARFYFANGANVHFGQPPEILPGWNLRLNVHTDGQGYDLLLEDETDKSASAALSDERGVIGECKWLQ
jgi:hypothetical protein